MKAFDTDILRGNPAVADRVATIPVAEQDYLSSFGSNHTTLGLLRSQRAFLRAFPANDELACLTFPRCELHIQPFQRSGKWENFCGREQAQQVLRRHAIRQETPQ